MVSKFHTLKKNANDKHCGIIMARWCQIMCLGFSSDFVPKLHHIIKILDRKSGCEATFMLTVKFLTIKDCNRGVPWSWIN